MVEHESKEVATAGERSIMPHRPSVSAEMVADTKEQIALLQGMVRDILQRGIDYGRIPGTPSDSLWDPGASLIINAFNGRVGQRRILSLRDDEERISVVMEIPIISRATSQEIASGIGAASTMETKYKYRWTDSLEEWGYTEDLARALRLRTRVRDRKTEWRIPNPEYSELLNTLVKMASKRAEVDAAESLPGAASVLRELFQGQAPQRAQEEMSPEWTRFWGKVRQLGLTQEQAHQRLRVRSMKDWLAQGKTLDNAIEVLSRPEAPPAETPEKVSDADVARQRIRGLMKKLGFDSPRAMSFLRDKAGVTKVEDIPEEKLHPIEMELSDWLALKEG